MLLIVLGVFAIVTETHTSHPRFRGVVTVFGEAAIWNGKTCLILAALPLMVWLPKRWLGLGVSLWWATLMAWLFVPFFIH